VTSGKSEEVMVRSHNVSDAADGSDRTWKKSSRTYGNGNCVEVAARSGDRVNVRDSKNPQGAVLGFTPAEWTTFLADVRAGGLGPA
jgi:uncharacterized protein DUF397